MFMSIVADTHYRTPSLPPSLSFLPLYLTVEAIEQAEAFLQQVMGEMEKRPNEEIICIPGNSVVVLLK